MTNNVSRRKLPVCVGCSASACRGRRRLASAYTLCTICARLAIMARLAAFAALLLTLTVVGVSARPGPAVNVNDWAHDVVDALKVKPFMDTNSKPLVGRLLSTQDVAC